jgi:anaerobic selenocysteine-containing dehydrogenase
MRYNELAKVERQFPDVGSEDLYYGGTAYKNTGGLGVQAATTADKGEAITAGPVTLPQTPIMEPSDLLVVPTTRLYNRERVFQPSEEALMRRHIAEPFVEINAADAEQMSIQDGDLVEVQVGNAAVRARAHVNGATPQGSLLLPRHLAETAAPLTIAAGQVSKVPEMVVEG